MRFKHTMGLEFLEEMRGIADGAQRALDDIVFINCFDEAYRIYSQAACWEEPKEDREFWERWERSMMACSSFAVRRDDGTILAGINLDQGIAEKELTRLVTAFVYRIPGQAAFVSVLVPGFVGALRGMNEFGVFAGHHTSQTRDVKKPAMPQGLLIRQGLQARTMSEFDAWFCRQRRCIGGNILVGDRSSMAVIEAATQKSCTRTSDQRFIISTNHFLTPTMQPLYKPEYVTPGFGHPEYVLEPEHSHRRYNRLQELLTQRIPQTPQEAMGYLESVSNNMTVQSVVFNSATRSVYVAVPREAVPPAPRNCSLFEVRL